MIYTHVLNRGGRGVRSPLDGAVWSWVRGRGREGGHVAESGYVDRAERRILLPSAAREAEEATGIGVALDVTA